jgi:hypothetical protein
MVVRIDWWHQLCHSWTHYLFVAPWIWLLNGARSTYFAAAWTLVNAHELAIISGMAAAYKVGAEVCAPLHGRDCLIWRLTDDASMMMNFNAVSGAVGE